MNARDSLDGVVVTVKLAITEFGPKRVANELRSMADLLECRGQLPGWNFQTDGMETPAKPGGRGNAA
jgi:hypothetical protein